MRKTIGEGDDECGAQTTRYWVERYGDGRKPHRTWGHIDCNEQISALCLEFMNDANIVAWGFTNKIDHISEPAPA